MTISPDIPDTKHCPKCDRNLPRTAFGPSKQTKDGLFGWCRECKRGGDRQSHVDHREERTAKMRAYYHADPEPQRARSRARAQANPEENRARATAWNRANLERRNAIARASDARRYLIVPERFREQWRRRNAVLRKGVKATPFTLEQLAAKLDYYGGRCRWCGAEAECWDHVKPLGKGGPHMLSNLTPACTPCNARKRDLWPLARWLFVLARAPR